MDSEHHHHHRRPEDETIVVIRPNSGQSGDILVAGLSALAGHEGG